MKTTYIKVTKKIEEKDWALINLFTKRFITLWANLKDLNLGVISGSFSKKSDGSYSGGLELPNLFRLKGLYVDFRHFYLQKDNPTYIYRIANFMSELTDAVEYKHFIKKKKKNLKSDFIERGWFVYKGKSFKTSEILDVWFNAEILHSDSVKIKKLLNFQKILEHKTAQSMLFMAIYDTILIVRNLHWSINELKPNNLFLKMPIKI